MAAFIVDFVALSGCQRQSRPSPIPAHVFSPRPATRVLLFFNLDNKVIGIEFGAAPTGAEGPHSLVMPLQTIIDKFDTQVDAPRRITLVLSTTTVTGQVQTVTASANAQLRPVAEPVLGIATEASSHIADEDDRPVLHKARLQLDLSQSRIGQLWLDLYMQHSDEVRRLLDTQRRFATVWHRSGGAGLFQAMVRAFHDPQIRIPAEINGRSVSHCIELVARHTHSVWQCRYKTRLAKVALLRARCRWAYLSRSARSLEITRRILYLANGVIQESSIGRSSRYSRTYRR